MMMPKEEARKPECSLTRRRRRREDREDGTGVFAAFEEEEKRPIERITLHERRRERHWDEYRRGRVEEEARNAHQQPRSSDDEDTIVLLICSASCASLVPSFTYARLLGCAKGLGMWLSGDSVHKVDSSYKWVKQCQDVLWSSRYWIDSSGLRRQGRMRHGTR